VFIGVGSNLGDRLATLHGAIAAFSSGSVRATRFLRASPIYETRPIGPSKERFFNAVLELETRLTPSSLLAELLAVELRFGRVRTFQGAARTLDLDLLAYVDDDPQIGSVQVHSPTLRCPHPELARRDFVLVPLCTLAPSLRPWGQDTVSELLSALPSSAGTIVRQLT